MVAFPRTAYPVAVRLVVEAPPFMERRPDVIVDEALERKPLVNVVNPLMPKVPNVASWEKRFVELAVAEKRDDDVALPSDELVEVRSVAATEPAKDEPVMVTLAS